MENSKLKEKLEKRLKTYQVLSYKAIVLFILSLIILFSFHEKNDSLFLGLFVGFSSFFLSEWIITSSRALAIGEKLLELEED